MRNFLFLALMAAIFAISTIIPGNAACAAPASDGLVLVKGGTFRMGSPESEAWRVKDETQHSVTVDDFYIGSCEVTQREYSEITGKDPSNFKGAGLPVENVSWLDAAEFCNAKSKKEGLSPTYKIEGDKVAWDRSANGYRLPTEAEWEYACRAGSVTPFNTENSPSADVCNYYGHYPYLIEENYFSQENLETKPGMYRENTVEAKSFAPNKFGLYNMHGNVGEWVWDFYGPYGGSEKNPSGPVKGSMRVYRGGGWNDFAKNLRSAYRGAMAQDKRTFNVGFRIARNAAPGKGLVVSEPRKSKVSHGGKTLIVFFSWGGTTKGIAEQIQKQSGADIFEITLAKPYSTQYHTVLEEAQRDQNIQARPALAAKVKDFAKYDTILIGYPNWWALIPMPIASFLEEYDCTGKTLVPFCSHGGGRFGQSLTAIAKSAPAAAIGEPLSVHYSGGSNLSKDIDRWLKRNGVKK